MNEMGPNVRKLFILRLSHAVVPANGGMADGIRFFQDQALRHETMATAQEWVQQAIVAVRLAPGPNPWKDADDETIAAELLRKVDERNGKG